ncbi:MAG: transcriptional regulator [Dethiobacter sp.]|jgi:predicted DNA-binding transcriptional regulator YafY|nr:MAG: transcriptional regulator [Dethiobacter sp.]
MNKTERIIKVILALSQNPAASASDLADRLQVSERSVYRYLNDIKRLGFPLHNFKDAESGLQRHYLTPLTFTAAEALAIVAAGQSLLSQEGLPLCDDLGTALLKVKAAICSIEDKRAFYRLEPRFTYLSEKIRDYSPWQGLIQQITECIYHCRSIIVVYDSFSSDEVTERLIDPYDLYWNKGNLYLAAYCHKHNNMRSFRIDRFNSVKKVGARFNRNPEFDLNKYLGPSWQVYRGNEDAIKAKILVYPPAARLFRETRYHETQELEELEDGKLSCTFKVPDTPEFRTWLLGWGSQVEVLEPAGLRKRIVVELNEALARYFN